MRSAWKSWALGGAFVVLFATLRLATLVGGQAGSTQEPFRGDPDNMLRVDGTRGPVDLGLMDPALIGAIASTDCGFTTNPFPPDCFAIMAKQRRAQGITERELDLMFKESPAKLLGLPPWREVSAPSTATRP